MAGAGMTVWSGEWSGNVHRPLRHTIIALRAIAGHGGAGATFWTSG